ncbi:MAG TPA: ABC transporter substrate-binding protein [Acidimicrobiales bacterium]|nr:ABC transporter substrate-binding protein [Acidimicrobiales bacterium]
MKSYKRAHDGLSTRKGSSRWTRVVAVVAGLAVVAAACGDSDDDSGGVTGPTTTSAGASATTTLQPRSGGTLTFAAYSNIPGLDPNVALGSGTSGAIQMATIYGSLARYDVDKKIYTPDMLESFTANATSTEWTLKIRPGIKFTDGTDFNAEAVRFGLNRHRVGNSLPLTSCGEYIACPRNTQSSAAYMTLVSDIVAVDALTVKVTLSEPWTSFPYALASEPGFIPSPTALKKCDPTKNPNTCEFNLKPVGAGPYMISAFKVGESIEMVKNPGYFNGPVYLDGIKFVALGDLGGDRTYDALKTGTVQGAYLRVASAVAQAKADNATGIPGIDQAGETMLINMGVSVNCVGGAPAPLCVGKPDGATPTTPATTNLKLRQAIVAAFDPKAWNERVYQGKGLTGTELFQKSFPWDPGVAGPAYDLERAKTLVTQAKAEGWNGTVRVLFTNSAVDANAAVALDGMLRAAGINPVVDTSKDSTAEQAIVVGSKDFDLARWGTAIGPDDSALWSLAQALGSTAASNRVGFKSTAVDQALKDLRAAKDDNAKRAAYKIIAEEFNAQVPWINYSAVETLKAFSPKVQGVTGSHRQYLYFDKAWMQP